MDATANQSRLCLDPPVVSVVLPVLNEAEILEELSCQVSKSIRESGCEPEIVFVNDGSSDSTPELLDLIAGQCPWVRVIHLSRNFGHQAAILAGLEHATGSAVVVMDADLQDDPATIAQFLERWRDGFDVVYAIRRRRKEQAWKKLLFLTFYRGLNAVSQTAMPLDAGNFGLMDARVVREIIALRDCDRYFAGLRSWVGFRQVGVMVERGARYDSTPRVSLRSLWRLAQSAIFSFSTMPVSVFFLLAIASGAVFSAVAILSALPAFLRGESVSTASGFVLLASFLCALNSLGIAVIGQYIVRIYDQVRSRPMFLVDRKVNCQEPLHAESHREEKRHAA